MNPAQNSTSPEGADRRGISPYSTKEKIARMLWAMTRGTIYHYSFHNWYRWRRLIVCAFGAKLAPDVRLMRTVRIECPWNLSMGGNSSAGDRAILYCLGPVTIGERVSISQGAHLCAGTHTYTSPDLPLVRATITIEDDAWIAADAFVGPWVRVGAGAILGSRGCAMRNLDAWTIYSGNPATKVKDRPRFQDAKDAR